jgi:hypothetical protein
LFDIGLEVEEMTKRKEKLIVGSLLVFAGIVLLFFMLSSGDKYPQEEVDVFAKCLTNEGAIMYGAFWCPHCARTKKNFGSSFEFIDYVECDPRGDNEQSVLCIEKGIEAYDTWEFSDGSRVVGEPSFEELSEGSGCAVPGEENGS